MVYGYATGVVIDHNEIESPGDAGINLVGNDKASSGFSRLFPSNCSITYNKVSNAGYLATLYYCLFYYSHNFL